MMSAKGMDLDGIGCFMFLSICALSYAAVLIARIIYSQGL